MIEFTRLVAKQARAVFRKALGNRLNHLRLLAGPGGLRIQGQSFEHAVEFHDPAPRAEALLMVPLAVLDDVQGSRSDPVALSIPKKSVLAASWKDRGVARGAVSPAEGSSGGLSDGPSSFREHPPGLVAALRDAFETTDSNGSRYALGCIQLRGKSGDIAATDGRHLLLQSGYAFGFDDDSLVQNTRLFSAKELPQDQPVLVGKTDTHLTVRIKDLIRAIKAEKRNQKSLKLALDSLKQLQAAA